MSTPATVIATVPPQATPPGGAPNPAPNAPPAPSATPPTPPSHWAAGLEGLPPETVDWLGKSSFKTPAAALASFHNLERLKGVASERVVELPKDDADEAGWARLRERLGVPQSADGYQLEGYDPAAVEAGEVDLVPNLREWAHEAGLTPKQAQTLYSRYTARERELLEEGVAAFQAASAAGVETLRREWGPAYDAKVGAMRAAAAHLGALGWTPDDFEDFERARGTERFMRLFSSLGERLGEARALPGGAGGGGGEGILTPQLAAQKIESLKRDQEFFKRRESGDPAAEKLWRELHEVAAGKGT